MSTVEPIVNDNATEVIQEEAIKPITIKNLNGRMWTLDFNRRAIEQNARTDELAKAVSNLDEGNMMAMLGIWSYAIPRIMVIASQMHHTPPMPLSAAENWYESLSNRGKFALRIVGLYIQRLNERMFDPNADDDEGNALWE